MSAAALRTPAPVVTPQPPAPAPAPRARAAAPLVRQPAGWPPAVRLSRAGAAAPAVATKRLLGTQTALRVSSPSDPAEHEATATASKIVRMELSESSTAYVRGASDAHRQAQREQARPIRTASSDSAITRRAARHGLAWRLGGGAVQRQAQGPASATPSIASAIQASMSEGRPLPMDVRRFMEPRFRADFGDVRIHTGDRAAALNRQLNARAFTVGSHIFFGRGAFQPETQAGQELIAHELTHTVQQGAAVQRSVDVSVTQQSPTQVQRLGLSDILDGLAELAANVPGFTLLTVIIGRNPINMRVVERNFTNLLRGFMGLIPGGEILFQVLNRYGIVERLGAWVDQQVSAIGLSYDYIRGRFTEFTDSLSWRDIFSPGDVWRRAQNIFTEPITRIRNFISRLIDQAIAWLKETFMQPLSDFCRQIPGYTLVTVLLGRDPFTNAPVERSALNVVRAFAEFIPGGTEKVNQLVESRALQRAYEWFIQETQARNLTWARVTGTFAQAWNSLRLEDVLHPIDTLQRIVSMFRPLMSDLVSFAGAALMKLLELIFEAVMGAGGARILAILKRGRDTFLTIIRNPVGFLGNLLRAVGQGVRQFMTNILRHLQQGVIAWLTGPVARAGIQMPERWDLRGIIWFVLQILGLTWDRIRQKLVRLMGERAVAMLEAGFQLIQEIREKGLVQALRDRVTEFFGQLRDAALGSIRSFIQQRLVMAGITQLLSLLNPVGAVIQAIIKTYTTIQFFIQRINQILDLVESIVNSIAAIASGSIGAAANFIEQTMARTIPVILDFLARFIGLGDVGGQVQRTIQGLQARVDTMLDRAVDWIRSMAQRVAGAATQLVERIAEWWNERTPFRTRNGEEHTIFFEGPGPTARLMIATAPIDYLTFVNRLNAPTPPAAAAKANAITIANQINTIRAHATMTPNQKATAIRNAVRRLIRETGEVLSQAGPGTNTYPGSGIDPAGRTNIELWQDLLPNAIAGATETGAEIVQRRMMARGLLFRRYAGPSRDIATQIDRHNLGRDMRPFSVQRNESEHSPNAHVIRRHVLNGRGEIKNTRDLALRALLNTPQTTNFTASAFVSVNDADTAIQAAIAGHIAARGGWPTFREHLVTTAPGTNATPGPMAAGGPNVEIWRNRRGSVVPEADLPAYLRGYTFAGTTISAAAAGTRPLYTGDPTPGLSGQPLAVRVPFSGTIELVLFPHRTAIGGYWVLTAYPAT